MSFSELSEGLMESLSAVDEGTETPASEGTETPAASDDGNGEEGQNADNTPVDEGGQPAVEDPKTVDNNTTPAANVTPEDLENLKNSLFDRISQELNKPKEEPAAEGSEDGKAEEGEGEPNPITELAQKADALKGLSEEEIRDKIFEDPFDVVNTLVAAGLQEKLGELMPKLEPIIKESEERAKLEADQNTAREFVNEFAEKTPDFKEYAKDVAKIIQDENMDMDPKNLEIAYWKAKSNSVADPGKKTLEEFLGDEESLKQLIGNEKLQDQIITQYLKGLADGNAPKSISNSDGSAPVGNGERKTNGFKDVANELLRKLEA